MIISTYVDQADALSAGIVSYTANTFRMGADDTTTLSPKCVISVLSQVQAVEATKRADS